MIRRKRKAEILDGINQAISKSKFIANNTIEIHYSNGDRAIRLHNADVITFKSNGYIVLNSGGWKTPTTKARINEHLPSSMQLCQSNHNWFIYVAMPDYLKKLVFYDGMIFNTKRKLIGREKKINVTAQNKLKQKIGRYVKLIDSKLPQPSKGDCFYCLMTDSKTGQNIGDAFKDKDHLLSHLKENYLVGSLLVNAMLERGYQSQQIAFHYQLDSRWAFKNAVRQYLTKRLIKDNFK